MFHVHDNDRWGVIAPEFLRNNTWFESLVIQLSTYMVKVVNRMNGQVQVPLRFFFNNLVLFLSAIYDKHLCPSGLRGSTQVRMYSYSWVQIPPDAGTGGFLSVSVPYHHY